MASKKKITAHEELQLLYDAILAGTITPAEAGVLIKAHKADWQERLQQEAREELEKLATASKKKRQG